MTDPHPTRAFWTAAAFALACAPLASPAQCYNGADLSYANAVEDAGGLFRDVDGADVDPFDYFVTRGARVVRLRLWHTPENVESACGTPITSGNLADVVRAARRARDAGADVMLALHYSDYFADPGKQVRPAAWRGLAGATLNDSIYDYTSRVLEQLRGAGATPAIVAIGNETDNGFVDATDATDGFEWPADAGKFNAGLRAVDSFNARFSESCRKALHLTVRYARFGVEEFAANGVTDYDLLGLSYYPLFDPETTVAEVGDLVRDLRAATARDVMLFETGFAWTRSGFSDDYDNFLSSNGRVVDQPTSREGQRDFLLALTTAVTDAGGLGIVYWEPAWVTSDMCDRWGRGSSYESATFFDFENEHRALPAFEFLACGLVGLRQNNARDAGPSVRVFPNPYVGGRVYVATTEVSTAWRLVDEVGRELARAAPGAPPTRMLTLPEPLAGGGAYFLELSFAGGRKATVRVIAAARE